MKTLIIIGGAEDREGECSILKEVVVLTKERQGPMIIITTATKSPEKVGEEYRETFYHLGLKEAQVLHIDSRRRAHDPSIAQQLKKAAAIFFTGGDQLRITSLLGGTSFYASLCQAYENGAILIGTSAGAAIMSSVMIVSGESEEPPRKCALKLAPGLGLLKDVVIDQHFAQRGRLGRLLGAIAQNPSILGIGIDEDTGILIKDGPVFQVIGSQAVTIVDGRNLTYSNVSELAPKEPLALFNITIHVLPKDYLFHLHQKRPMEQERA